MNFLTVDNIRMALLDDGLRNAYQGFVHQYMDNSRRKRSDYVEALRSEHGIKTTKDFLDRLLKGRSSSDCISGEATFYDGTQNNYYNRRPENPFIGRVSTAVKVRKTSWRFGSIQPFLRVELNEDLGLREKLNLPEKYNGFGIEYFKRSPSLIKGCG
ncbi:MAG: hypothetical protein Q7S27_00425 [Nanoarchaeota archaeon]|nr:hypothetical protein [Nanoarchaeota archaeon]